MSGLNIIVKTIMSTKIFTIGKDDSIKTLINIFEHVKFHHVPVLDENKLVGLISETELLRKMTQYPITKKNHSEMNFKIHQVMDRNPITIQQSDTIRTAIDNFLTSNIGCMPVVTKSGELKGMLSWKDVLQMTVKKIGVDTT